MGYLQTTLGKYSEAEEFYKKSLVIFTQLFETHPDVAQNQNDLAWIYFKRGQYNEAEGLYIQSLETREKCLGKDHPHVARSTKTY